MRTISNIEYRRRVFNAALLECFCEIHNRVLNGGFINEPTDKHMVDMARRLCCAFYKDELNLDKQTITQTKHRLSEAAEFIKDCVNTAECIAENKADQAKDSNIVFTDEDDIELSDEDKDVIQQLFNTKSPTPQIEAIRDATVKALMAEDQKAHDIKQAIDIAQAKVAAGEPPETLEETVNRINKIGPTSLMNAIINNITVAAVKDINENGNFQNVGKVMQDNADEIKTRAVAIYSLYESTSVLGIHKYAEHEVKKLAMNIFYEK